MYSRTLGLNVRVRVRVRVRARAWARARAKARVRARREEVVQAHHARVRRVVLHEALVSGGEWW